MIGTDDQLFGRVVTAMVTPFDDDLRIDYPAVERLVEHLLDTGTASIVVAGTTGESPTLEDQEKTELLRFVVRQADGRAKIIMGTGSNDTSRTIRASKEAEDLGANGLLVVAPYYNKPNQDGLKAHFTAVAKATKLPILVYNIPGRTGINISVDTLVALAGECETIKGLKESTGNVDQAQDIGRLAPADFRIYSGDDYLTLPFLSVGACGVVSVASHLIGTEIDKMIVAFRAGKVDEARAIHYLWLPLFKGLFLAPNPSCVKYALSRLGLLRPNLRLPLVPPAESIRKTLDEFLSGEAARAASRSFVKS